MQYTLSMLKDQLIKRSYTVTSIIYSDSSGKMHNQNDQAFFESAWFSSFRFCAAPNDPEANSLYIYELNKQTVQLSNGPFCLNVLDVDYSGVCETVIEICQILSNWERDLRDLAWSGAGYQELIDRADDLFDNPIFLCNWQGNVHGYSKRYEHEWIRPTWNSITTEGRVPGSSLTAIMNSEYINFLSQENSVHFIEFPELSFRSIFGLVHVNKEIVLQFQIIEYSHKVTDADLELAQIFLDALRIAFTTNSITSHESALDVFRQLIKGDLVSVSSMQWALDYLGWIEPNSSYNLLLFKDRSGNPCEKNSRFQIERILPGSRSIDHDGDMVMLIPSSLLSEYERELRFAAEAHSIYCGVSLTFSDWYSLSESFEQALSAIAHCTKSMPICYGIDYAWSYVITSIEDKLHEAGLMHPAISLLTAYDKEHGTELVKTLYQFLACERSNVETAAKLFIHRNSLKYRLDKINDLIHVDLDDLNTRMHLLVTLMAMESNFET